MFPVGSYQVPCQIHFVIVLQGCRMVIPVFIVAVSLVWILILGSAAFILAFFCYQGRCPFPVPEIIKIPVCSRI
jgi:hypothetical protein